MSERDNDDRWEEHFDKLAQGGRVVLTKEEWRDKLDEAAGGGYGEGRKDEREELGRMLAEEAAEVRRTGEGCTDGRYDWMAAGIDAVADTLRGIDSATGEPATPELLAALTQGRVSWNAEPAITRIEFAPGHENARMTSEQVAALMRKVRLAPRMLAALKAYVHAVAVGGGDDKASVMAAIRAADNEARAVIAEAEGRS